MQPDLEQAWRELDAAERALPDCEHVRDWKAQIAAARERYRAVLRSADAAETMRPKPLPAPSSLLPAEPEPADDGALFPLEAA